jgi:thioredoxin-related protein
MVGSPGVKQGSSRRKIDLDQKRNFLFQCLAREVEIRSFRKEFVLFLQGVGFIVLPGWLQKTTDFELILVFIQRELKSVSQTGFGWFGKGFLGEKEMRNEKENAHKT